MKYFLIGTLGLGLLSLDAPAQTSDRAPGATFEACVAARVAVSAGRITAEAAARKACREQFPATSEEADIVRRRALMTGISTPISPTGPAVGSEPVVGTTVTAAPTVALPGPSASPAPAPFIPPPGGPMGAPGASGGAPGVGKH